MIYRYGLTQSYEVPNGRLWGLDQIGVGEGSRERNKGKSFSQHDKRNKETATVLGLSVRRRSEMLAQIIDNSTTWNRKRS